MISNQLTNRAESLFNELNSVILKLPGQMPNWYNKGLALENIEANEKRLGIHLPDEHKAALLFFDGFDEAGLDLYFEGERVGFGGFSSINNWGIDETVEQQIEDAKMLEEEGIPIEADGPVKALFYHPKWIEFAHGGEVSWCLDFSPEPGGVNGQIIMVWTQDDILSIRVVASNFLDFVEKVIIRSTKDVLEGNIPEDDW